MVLEVNGQHFENDATKPEQPAIKITDPAKNKLKEELGKNPGKYLRVYFEGFG
jgi:hypothetical protein